MALFKKKSKGFSNRHDDEKEKIGGKLNFQASEAYKLLRTNLEFSFTDDKKCKVIGITSALSSEGKSLTTINLGYSIATNNKKVMIIEADFRKPTVFSKLGMQVENGLTDYLVGHEHSEQDIIRGVRLAETVKFDFAPAGRIPPNPSELLDSRKMAEFIEKCSATYDYILIDLPPVTVVADAVVASKLVDGMVVVVRQDQSDQKSVAETVRQLKFSNTRILGFVFNSYNQARSRGYKYYKKYGKKGYYETPYQNSGTSVVNG